MDTLELFPGEARVRDEVLDAGWSETVGNGWALVFAGPEDSLGYDLTLRGYPSFFLEDVSPAFLLVETLEGDPVRAPRGCGPGRWLLRQAPRAGGRGGFRRGRRRVGGGVLRRLPRRTLRGRDPWDEELLRVPEAVEASASGSAP